MAKIILTLAILVDAFLVVVIGYFSMFPYRPDAHWSMRLLGVGIGVAIAFRLVKNVRDWRKRETS